MGVIVDTTILIAAERRQFDMPAFLSSLGEVPVALAAIAAAELLHGVERAAAAAQRVRRGAFVESVLAAIPIVPFGLPEARRHAQVWAELERSGNLIGPHDLQVAATALAGDFAVATLNRREFERVPGLTLAPTESFLIATGSRREA